MTLDIDNLFTHLASQSRLPKLNRLIIAPFQLQHKLIEQMDVLTKAARHGNDTRIILKMNALTDEALMLALVRASQAGVKVDLIVRGACMLPAGVPDITENIRVRSIIGRFLEHSRVFYFRCDTEETLLLSSADWMNRNMLRRVELAWSVKDPNIRQRIVDECLVAYLHDGVDAWDLCPDGRYERADLNTDQIRHGAQAALMARYSGAEVSSLTVKLTPKGSRWT